MASPPCASRLGAWLEGWGQPGADFFWGTMGSQDLRQDVEGPRVKVVGCVCRRGVGAWDVAEHMGFCGYRRGDGRGRWGSAPPVGVPKQTGPRPCAGLPPLPALLLPPLRPWRLP